LDHVNIRTANLADMTTFYTQTLGLNAGPRPPFEFGGAWLYCGEQAVVHLVEVDVQPSLNQVQIEHFAFLASGLSRFLSRLKTLATAYDVQLIPESGRRQINVRDPDGNHIEIQFAAEEQADLES
ncbi:MAG: VOC family protein, partial [Pseudomonadota bacterium]|nr:VOC family protein [Pseudomonadota bacterium]